MNTNLPRLPDVSGNDSTHLIIIFTLHNLSYHFCGVILRQIQTAVCGGCVAILVLMSVNLCVLMLLVFPSQ